MSKTRLIGLFSLIAGLIMGLTLLDMARETEMPPLGEILIDLAEKLILVGAMAVVAWTVHGVMDLREHQVALSNNLARSLAQGDAWREQRRGEIEALGKAIEDQFRQWQLSAAEIDVAGLMLKGASLKEIALARDTSEVTIRQQAQAIYRKSGLSGRAELSAYFLESLFEAADDASRKRPSLSLVTPQA
jgi:DNA-binding CsgD family transcriptional regulator